MFSTPALKCFTGPKAHSCWEEADTGLNSADIESGILHERRLAVNRALPCRPAPPLPRKAAPVLINRIGYLV